MVTAGIAIIILYPKQLHYVTILKQTQLSSEKYPYLVPLYWLIVSPSRIIPNQHASLYNRFSL